MESEISLIMIIVEKIKSILEHPLTKNLNLDDPKTTEIRKNIIKSKPFLYKIYKEWYININNTLPDIEGDILEIGTGAGFMNEFIPEVITSDLLKYSGIDYKIDACKKIPFKDSSMKAIVMINVFHHLPNVKNFLLEAIRVTRTNGKIIMIEPWVTNWSCFIYKNFHHEPFDPESTTYTLPENGPLSCANGALPWIIFDRDWATFNVNFPELSIAEIKPIMPFRYLLSGGISMRNIMPGWSFGIWRSIENSFRAWNNKIAMFAQITLNRK